MNLDLLKKLTRLANNNPNDNEANLAARRVCKMLEEGDWSLATTKTAQAKVNVASNPNTQSGDWIKKKYERNKQKEDDDVTKDLWEFIRKMGLDPNMSYGGARGSGKYSDPFYVEFDESTKSASYSKDEKKTLECSRCHKIVETKYVGNLFICNTCQWTLYQESKIPDF